MLGTVSSSTLRSGVPASLLLRCLPSTVPAAASTSASAAPPVPAAGAALSLGPRYQQWQQQRGFAAGSRSSPPEDPASVLDALTGGITNANASASASAATATAAATAVTTTSATGPGRTSGARRSSQHRAEKTRHSRRRQSYLDLLQQLRGQHFELTDQVGNMQFWSVGDDTRWRFADEPQYDLHSGVSQGPVWRLPASVDESRAIVDPDLYEIEVQEDQHGRCIVKVVQVGDASGFTDSPDEGEDPV